MITFRLYDFSLVIQALLHGGIICIMDIRERLKQAYNIIVQVQRDKATGILEFELKEMENVFVLLLLGSLVGFPSPPAAISIELLPYLEKEIKIMVSRADMAQDPLGMLLGMLEID